MGCFCSVRDARVLLVRDCIVIKLVAEGDPLFSLLFEKRGWGILLQTELSSRRS